MRFDPPDFYGIKPNKSNNKSIKEVIDRIEKIFKTKKVHSEKRKPYEKYIEVTDEENEILWKNHKTGKDKRVAFFFGQNEHPYFYVHVGDKREAFTVYQGEKDYNGWYIDMWTPEFEYAIRKWAKKQGAKYFMEDLNPGVVSKISLKFGVNPKNIFVYRVSNPQFSFSKYTSESNPLVVVTSKFKKEFLEKYPRAKKINL